MTPPRTTSAPSSALATAPAPSGAVAPAGQPDIFQLLKRSEAAIERALPKHISAERFARVSLTALRNSPQLQRCDPASFLGALMTSAQLGLEPNTPLGHAYLIPFKRECTFILGYKGMVDLARRNGVVVMARTVYEGDEFDFQYGTDEKIVHRPVLGEQDRGPAIAYYATARWEGESQMLVASKADIDARRARSKASNNGPWQTDYDAMARKTTVRMMAPFLPLSVELATAVESDDLSLRWDVNADDFIDAEGEDVEPATEVGAGAEDESVDPAELLDAPPAEAS